MFEEILETLLVGKLIKNTVKRGEKGVRTVVPRVNSTAPRRQFFSENLSAVYRPSPYELLAREAPESSIQ